MTLDNMTGITKASYTGGDLFCKSQLITCSRVKECNGVCPFEDALKHADKEMDEQTVIDHDRDWIIGCLEHDGFIHTHRFDKANQIILDALSAEAVQGWIPCSERLPDAEDCPMDCMVTRRSKYIGNYVDIAVAEKNGTWTHEDWNAIVIDGKATCISTRDADIIAWMPLPKPYKGGDDE